MTKGPRLLSELRFGALFTYSPRGTSEVSIRSRKARDVIKYDTPGMIAKAVALLKEKLETSGLSEFFGPDVTLVPVPRSAPLKDERSLWPARRICEELLTLGLGKEILPCLIRTKPVPKSAYAPRGERPGVDAQLESLAVETSLLVPEKETLVDDFVTKGATLLASTSLLKEAFSGTSVLAFALVRTMGLVPEVEKIVDPCVGRIYSKAGKIYREP